MASAPNLIIERKRIPKLPLGKIREIYDNAESQVVRLVEVDPLGIPDPGDLMLLAANVKSALLKFNECSQQLADKLLDIRSVEEAQQLRQDRWRIRREVHEMIKLINSSLQLHNSDSISNVDTASVISDQVKTLDKVDAERCDSLGVSVVPSLACGPDRDLSAIASGGGAGGRLTTFKAMLWPCCLLTLMVSRMPEGSLSLQTCVMGPVLVSLGMSLMRLFCPLGSVALLGSFLYWVHRMSCFPLQSPRFLCNRVPSPRCHQ